jgi:hypothetical protein
MASRRLTWQDQSAPPPPAFASSSSGADVLLAFRCQAHLSPSPPPCPDSLHIQDMMQTPRQECGCQPSALHLPALTTAHTDTHTSLAPNRQTFRFPSAIRRSLHHAAYASQLHTILRGSEEHFACSHIRRNMACHKRTGCIPRKSVTSWR